MGWAIRLGMGRSEVPDVHIHNTKCFPRVSPQPQALAPSLPSSRGHPRIQGGGLGGHRMKASTSPAPAGLGVN